MITHSTNITISVVLTTHLRNDNTKYSINLPCEHHDVPSYAITACELFLVDINPANISTILESSSHILVEVITTHMASMLLRRLLNVPKLL
jgi:hypothetical protein